MRARLALVTLPLLLLMADLALAQAGGGSSGFGGGGGGSSGGGGGFGGGGSGSGSGSASPLVIALFFAVFGIVWAWVLFYSWRYRRRVRERDAEVRRASAEAAEDDAYFAADEVEREALRLFREAQAAWDLRDRTRLASLIGPDLHVEWSRRLDDFERKGWHNRVQVLGDPKIHYVGITNREDDREDRAVVQVVATLRSYVEDRSGSRILKKGESDDTISLRQYWTLSRGPDGWLVTSIEEKAEGDHHLESKIVASPWADSRLADESLTELAVADSVPEGFTTADLADLDFDESARAEALDLSLADARFSPDVLEIAARRAVEAWAEAVDGADAPLERVASAEAVLALLYGGDATRQTRLVVRGPRVRRIEIVAVDVRAQPATMTVELDVFGRRYVENRDTAAVLEGSRERPAGFTERWTLALDGPDAAPWRLVYASAAHAA